MGLMLAMKAIAHIAANETSITPVAAKAQDIPANTTPHARLAT